MEFDVSVSQSSPNTWPVFFCFIFFEFIIKKCAGIFLSIAVFVWCQKTAQSLVGYMFRTVEILIVVMCDIILHLSLIALDISSLSYCPYLSRSNLCDWVENSATPFFLLGQCRHRTTLRNHIKTFCIYPRSRPSVSHFQSLKIRQSTSLSCSRFPGMTDQFWGSNMAKSSVR